MGIADADSAEHNVPTASHIIVPVSCAVPNRAPGAPKLSGENQVRAVPGTKLAAILGTAAIEERFFCNYEVNDAFRPRLEAAGMKVSAVGHQGETRAIELATHPFFVATLFQPQLTSKSSGQPHPLIRAFLKAIGG
jgi:CTP synthase (UTP-ammonia lyase)